MSRSEWASAVALPFQGDCAPSAMPPAAALLMLPLLRCHFASASSYRVLSVRAASPRGLVQASRELLDKVQAVDLTRFKSLGSGPFAWKKEGFLSIRHLLSRNHHTKEACS